MPCLRQNVASEKASVSSVIASASAAESEALIFDFVNGQACFIMAG